MSLVRIERETREQALSRVTKNRERHIDNGFVQSESEEHFTLQRVGLRRTLVLFEGMLGQMNIPLIPERHTLIFTPEN